MQTKPTEQSSFVSQNPSLGHELQRALVVHEIPEPPVPPSPRGSPDSLFSQPDEHAAKSVSTPSHR
jgi:hypothetical protein